MALTVGDGRSFVLPNVLKPSEPPAVLLAYWSCLKPMADYFMVYCIDFIYIKLVPVYLLRLLWSTISRLRSN